MWNEIEHVTEEDNLMLCESFSETENKNALFQMEKSKAAGPR